MPCDRPRVTARDPHRARAGRERPHRQAVQPRRAPAAGRAGARALITSSVLVVAIVVLAVLIVVGLLLLVVHGVVRALVARLRERRIGAARDALLSAARRGEPDEAAGLALRAIPRERALALLEELAPSLAGPELDALSAIARQRGLIADAEAGVHEPALAAAPARRARPRAARRRRGLRAAAARRPARRGPRAGGRVGRRAPGIGERSS